ncbi:unnamed protein product [Arabis nemorensis]|uniref:Uncharacterized protein n=1 Tax=Arabis nemorensis TaxID=586526 RepID=A0A565C7W1_9BRAS|nr:unnamed protein product [Arabis nemorensis]
MDSLSTQKTKSRKIKRIAKKSRVQIILDLFFRAIEIVVVLVTVAKLCNELVVTFQDSGVAEVILANRSLAFVVGNAIVIALIAKSGVFFNQEIDPKCKRNDLYDEFVRESSNRNRGKHSEAENEATQSITETRTKQSEVQKEKQSVTEKIEKQSISEKTEKHSVTEKKTKQSKPEKMTKQNVVEITVKKTEKQSLIEKKQSQSYRRSKSENLESLEKSSCGRLRRSETDVSSEIFDFDDELRYKIESFIARQRRNQNDD